MGVIEPERVGAWICLGILIGGAAALLMVALSGPIARFLWRRMCGLRGHVSDGTGAWDTHGHGVWTCGRCGWRKAL